MLKSRFLALAVFASLALTAHAQMTGRVFEYTPTGLVDTDYSMPGAPSMNFSTVITVNAYLFVSGTFDVAWTVDGPGEGVDSASTTIIIYHNETLNLDFQGFGDAVKTSGTMSGTQVIPVTASLDFFNHVSNALLMQILPMPASDLNSAMTPSSPTFDALSSGGALRIHFTREITLDPGVGPGTYESGGTVTIVRS